MADNRPLRSALRNRTNVMPPEPEPRGWFPAIGYFRDWFRFAAHDDQLGPEQEARAAERDTRRVHFGTPISHEKEIALYPAEYEQQRSRMLLPTGSGSGLPRRSPRQANLGQTIEPDTRSGTPALAGSSSVRGILRSPRPSNLEGTIESDRRSETAAGRDSSQRRVHFGTPITHERQIVLYPAEYPRNAFEQLMRSQTPAPFPSRSRRGSLRPAHAVDNLEGTIEPDMRIETPASTGARTRTPTTPRTPKRKSREAATGPSEYREPEVSVEDGSGTPPPTGARTRMPTTPRAPKKSREAFTQYRERKASEDDSAEVLLMYRPRSRLEFTPVPREPYKLKPPTLVFQPRVPAVSDGDRRSEMAYRSGPPSPTEAASSIDLDDSLYEDALEELEGLNIFDRDERGETAYASSSTELDDSIYEDALEEFEGLSVFDKDQKSEAAATPWRSPRLAMRASSIPLPSPQPGAIRMPQTPSQLDGTDVQRPLTTPQPNTTDIPRQRDFIHPDIILTPYVREPRTRRAKSRPRTPRQPGDTGMPQTPSQLDGTDVQRPLTTPQPNTTDIPRRREFIHPDIILTPYVREPRTPRAKSRPRTRLQPGDISMSQTSSLSGATDM